MEKREKKKKQKFVDDGRTVYSMDGLDEMRASSRPKGDGVRMTRAERRAMIRAAMSCYLPVLLGVIACFTAAALLLYFWLQ